MNRHSLRALVLAAALLMLAQASATDPPHDSSRSIQCNSCHMTHNAPGGNITAVGGNANLCISCHVSGGTASAKPFAAADQALPGPGLDAAHSPTGNSHRWDSGAAGHVTFGGGAAVASTGKISSGGSYTGIYPKTYTITITTAGNVATPARFSWTATAPPGGSGSNVAAGTNIVLDEGVTVTFTDGSTTPSFQLNDKWYVYVRPDLNSPTTPDMQMRAPNGVIMCSTCHDEHSQIRTPFDKTAPAYGGAGTGAGRHFQRIDNNTDQMCKDCHTAINVTSSLQGSHPVGVTIPAVGNYQAPVSPPAPVTLPLDASNNVACQSCHRVHYGPATDGTLRRETNTTSLCTACHTNSDTTTPAIHLSATSGVLWPGGYYGSTFPQVSDSTKRGYCTNCHRPHGWPDNVTPANSFPKLLVERTDIYDNKTDPSSAENLCYTCHDSRLVAATDVKTSFPAPGVVTNNNYQDTFPAQAYNNSTGSLDWSGTPWTETDAGGSGPASGYIMILVSTSTPSNANCPTSGDNCLQVRGNSTSNHIYRNAALSTGVSATLTFNWKLVTGGSYQVRCSPNTTTYTTLTGGTYSSAGTGTGTFTIPSSCLSTANPPVTRIDFKVSVSNTSGYFYVDNVNIAYTATSAGMQSGHPVDDAMQTSGPYRSVECRDCHEVHKATGRSHGYSATATATRNDVTGPLAGVTGVQPTFAAMWTTPTYGPYPNGLPLATHEYEICFKCHTSYSFGSTPPPGMSPNGSATRPVETDVAVEFNPNNKSGHPVVTGLDNYPNSLAVGSPAKKGLQAAYLKAPWATNIGQQTMMCSDCHNTDAASPAAQGPHGSAAQFLLRGANAANWPNVTLTNFATSWCANCHNNFTQEPHSGNHNSYPCYRCHIVIPHGSKVSRLIGDSNAAHMPARYAYNNDLTQMYLIGFKKMAVGSYTNGSTGSCATSNTSCNSNHTTSTTGFETW